MIRLEQTCDLQNPFTDQLSSVSDLQDSLTALVELFLFSALMGTELEHQTSPSGTLPVLRSIKPGITLGRCQPGCCNRRHLVPEGRRPLRAQHAQLS